MRSHLLNKLLILVSALALVACDDGDGDGGNADMADASIADGGGDTSTTTTDDMATTTEDMTTSTGEDLTDPDTVDPDMGDTTAPVIDATLVQAASAPLAATIEIELDEAAAVSIEITGTERTWTVESPSAMTHTVPVAGFRAESSYTFVVTATDAAGNASTDDSLTFETAALPDDFPPMTSTGEASGHTLLSFAARWNPGQDAGWSYLVIVDEVGEPIWYWKTPGYAVDDARMLPDGTIMTADQDGEAVVIIDVLGNEVNRWSAESLDMEDSVHHEVYPMPNGNFAFLSSELHQDIEYMGDPDSPHDIVSDVIVEFNPETGNVVGSWDLFDILDPQRKATPGFDLGFWDNHYATEAPDGTKDWTHANAVIYDPNDDAFIVSSRHQDWLIKFSRADGALIWTLGREGTLTMQGDGEWLLHPHAPMFGDTTDTILAFDNGNGREGLQPEQLYSRLVEYEIDESDPDPNNWTVTQTWEWVPDPIVYAPFVGDADYLPNGNILGAFGGIVADPAVPLFAPDNYKSAWIVEVDRAGNVVWELSVADPTEMIGYSIYRADRVEGL